MLINKIKYICILCTLAVLIINYNVYSKNTYLKYSPSEDALLDAVNSVIMIGDKPSSIGLSFYIMKNITTYGWSEQDVEYLKKHYPYTDNDILSKLFNKKK